MMQSTKIGLLLAALTLTSPAFAAPEGWRISEKSGTVTVLHSGVSKIALQGNAVAVGDVISTGTNGRAVLVRGQEYLVVAPGSRLRVADPAPSGGFVQIIQDVGNVIFKIKRKSTPHFAVQTPYLAAVVKGTTFSVTVSEAGASVQVIEGAVEVKTNDGGASDLVKPGMIAAVTARDLFSLKVDGETSQVTTSPNAPASQAPASDASATSAASETASTATSGNEPAATADPKAEPVAAVVEAKIEAPIVEAAQQVSALTGGLIEGMSTIASPVRAAEVRTETASAPAPVAQPAAAVETVPAPTQTAATTETSTPAPVQSATAMETSAPAPTQAPAATEMAAATPPADMLPPAFSGRDDDDASEDVSGKDDAEVDDKTQKDNSGNGNSGNGNGNAKDVATAATPPAPVEVAAVVPPVAALPPEVDVDDDRESGAAAEARETELEKANGKKKDVALVTPPAAIEAAAISPPAAVDTQPGNGNGNAIGLEKKKDVADSVALPPVAVEVAAVTPPAAVDTEPGNGNGNAFGLEKKKDVADSVVLPPAAVEVAAVTPPAAVDVQLGNGAGGDLGNGNGNAFGLDKESKGLKGGAGPGNSKD